jgi:aspartate kinase
MITTSEVAVSLTIDDETHLDAILAELKAYGEVEIDGGQTIICIVGHMLANQRGVLKRVMNAVGDLPVRMVSYGGSKYNISLLIDSNLKKEALNMLNTGLFEV